MALPIANLFTHVFQNIKNIYPHNFYEMFNNTYTFELKLSWTWHICTLTFISNVMSNRGAAGCSMASKCFMKEYIRAYI